MDSKPVAASRSSHNIEFFPRASQQGDDLGNDEEEPFSLNGPYIALFGIVIAIATVAVPLAAVLTERPLKRESLIPTSLESDGSKPPLPISLTRFSQSSS